MISVWIALVVMTVPLGIAVHLLLRADERSELERAALRAATQVDQGFLAGDPVELPVAEAGTQLGLFDPSGRLRAGTGPAFADLQTTRALQGQVGDAAMTSRLVIAIPVNAGEQTIGAIRASTSMAVVWQRTGVAWLALLGLVGAAQLAAVLVARRRARRLAAPLEQLAAASQAIGRGDFSVQVPDSGIEEIDRVSTIQNTTARRLVELLDRERQFTDNASHQLRTPLAGLQLVLENAAADTDDTLRGAVDEALATARRLRATVDDVLAVHRRGATAAGAGTSAGAGAAERTAIGSILDDLEDRWHGALASNGRVLTVTGPVPGGSVNVPGAAVAQILDVLVDNASRHGAGMVTVSVRSVGPALALDVTDEGPGVPAERGDIFVRGAGIDHGIGLALARDFAHSFGGRLLLSTRTPPTFTLMVPGGPHPAG